MKRFESLDAFRGLASLFVILFHSVFYVTYKANSFFQNADIFVDFFFILSGFVLTHAYGKSILSFKSFVIMRLGRLYPLYLFALLLWVPYIGVQVVLYSKGMGSENPLLTHSLMNFLRNLFFLQASAPTGGAGWNWPSWSVAVEFYLYVSFFLLIVRWKSHLLVKLAIVFVAYASLLQFDHILQTNWVAFLRGFGGFYLGSSIYTMYRNIPIEKIGNRVWDILEVTTLVLVVASVSCFTQNPQLLYLITMLLFALTTLLFALQDRGVVSRILQVPIFQHLGNISYSTYLLHGVVVSAASNSAVYLFHMTREPIEGVAEAIVTPFAPLINSIICLIIIGMASLTYRYLELPAYSKVKKWVQQ